MTTPIEAAVVEAEERARSGKTISVAHIVFFVVGAAAPLTAIVGSTPPAFALGQGPVVAGAFVLVGLVYLLFSVGFTAMSRHVGGAGGFYVYLAQGLGRPLGLGGALVMLMTYSAIQIAIYTLFGVYLADAVHAASGQAWPWWLFSLIGVVLTTLCGRRSVAFSGNLLAVFLAAEVAILVALDIAILLDGGGPAGFSLVPFYPSTFLTPHLMVAIIFIVGSFVGFEATTIFSEEVDNPAVAIPRATYLAVILITVFYTISAWAITLHYGPDAVSSKASESFEQFFFAPTAALLGGNAVILMRFLLEVSLFACVLSLHSSISRYLFALARDRLLPAPLAQKHPDFGSPYIAGTVQSLSAAVVLCLFALSGLDPYGVLFAWASVLGVVGILTVQLLVCFAVIQFFRRNRELYPGPWRALIAPALSAAALGGLLGELIGHLPLLAGSDSLAIYLLPLLVFAGLVGGAAMAVRLRKTRSQVYQGLGANLINI